jgi:hypothetical protein
VDNSNKKELSRFIWNLWKKQKKNENNTKLINITEEKVIVGSSE